MHPAKMLSDQFSFFFLSRDASYPLVHPFLKPYVTRLEAAGPRAALIWRTAECVCCPCRDTALPSLCFIRLPGSRPPRPHWGGCLNLHNGEGYRRNVYFYLQENKVKKTNRKLLNKGLLDCHPPPQAGRVAGGGSSAESTPIPHPHPDSAWSQGSSLSGPERSFRKQRKYGRSPGIWLSIFKKLSNSAIFFSSHSIFLVAKWEEMWGGGRGVEN